MPEAERLKAEGNALFVKNDFTGAYTKYSEAIKHDSHNAVLYCNRAACSLGMNRYMNAFSDATKATELDPGYPKAWSRLAAARIGLSNLDEAINAWERAIAAVPTENPTPAQAKQLAQYKEELAATKAKNETLKTNPTPTDAVAIPAGSDEMPWGRAQSMVQSLQARGVWESSAWVVFYAYQDWQEAVKALKLGRFTTLPGGAGRAYFGMTGVIEKLTNALIADSRVFHVSDSNFMQLYNQQMIFEATQSKAWTKASSRDVMEQLPRRLAAEGWDSVRPALSITIRGWVMRAFLEEKFRKNMETALEFYTSAIETLQWGNERYGNVANEAKGAIFQHSFLRGVKCMRLDALMKAHAANPGPNSKYPLEELLAGANDLLADLHDVPPQPHVQPIGYYLSFFRYPIGQAHAIRGFYYHHTAMRLRQTGGTPGQFHDMYKQASAEYSLAMACYPKDEEHHTWFAHTALRMQCEVGISVEDLLQRLDHLNETIPLMKRIWRFSADAQHRRDQVLDKDMELRSHTRHDLESGRVQAHDIVQVS